MTVDCKCPECGSGRHYLLNDHRLLCRDCRRKFTATLFRSRVPAERVSLICESFWKMLPVSEVAGELSMNRKTILRYYDLFRRGISGMTERLLMERYGTTECDGAAFREVRQGEPLFCIVRNGGRIWLLFAAETARETSSGLLPFGWVYARERRDFDQLDLDHIHYLGIGDNDPVGLSFWSFAKKGLLAYRGGFRKNFYHFIREMEFRFNNREASSACDVLREIVSRDTTNLIGDENV